MMAFSPAGSAPAVPMPMPAGAVAVPGQFLADPAAAPPPRLRRKRKADIHDANHERLNKRMSLLNLEQNGPKLYVPVEQSQLPSSIPGATGEAPTSLSTTTTTTTTTTTAAAVAFDEPMHLDDTKHKVYIYNLDDELSSNNSDDEDDEDGRLVILPDLAAHMRANRLCIPRPLPTPRRPSSDDDGLQVVLYQPDGPPSLSVPAEQDGVRRAIVAARERVRERQALERSSCGAALAQGASSAPLKRGVMSFATPVRVPRPPERDADGEMLLDEHGAWQSSGSRAAGGVSGGPDAGYDPDAMDID